MPYTEHSARVLDPEKFQPDTFRKKTITPSVDIIIDKLKGEPKTTVQTYRFAKDAFTVQEAKVWLKKNNVEYIDFEAAKSILSAKPEKKGKDLIVPFVKDGTEAFDKDGKKYIITAEALDADWKTWEGGIVTVNHKVKETGKIVETWRQKPFVFGRISGMSEDTQSIIFSPAYQGVSQESEPVEIDGDNVMRLQGTGCTFMIYPEIPSCSLKDGCGKIDIASILKSTTGATRDTKEIINALEYIAANPGQMGDDVRKALFTALDKLDRKQFMKDMMNELEKHPEMMDPELQDMMKKMVSIKPASDFSLNSQNSNSHIKIKSTGGTDDNMTGEEIGAKAPESIKSEKEALQKQTEALTSENAALKSQLTQAKEDLPKAIKSALESREAEEKQKREYEAAGKELYSVMKKETAEKFIAGKPSIESIRSTVVALKESGITNVGAGIGQIDSSRKSEYDSLNKRFNKKLGRK